MIDTENNSSSLSLSTSPQISDSEIYYRAIKPSDLSQIKELHNQLFPVKYSDSFFLAVVEGKCVRDGIQLFSSIAIQKRISLTLPNPPLPPHINQNNQNKSQRIEEEQNKKEEEEVEEIVGFLLAQTMLTSSCEEQNDLFSNENEQSKEVCYILTLGLKREMRRSGIGSILLQQCIQFASRIETCGAVINFFLLTLSLFSQPFHFLW